MESDQIGSSKSRRDHMGLDQISWNCCDQMILDLIYSNQIKLDKIIWDWIRLIKRYQMKSNESNQIG